MTDPHRAAVLGSPIAHSLSPVLHRAAYAELGLSWSYDAAEVDKDGLAAYLDGCNSSWAGLSLTMPLKEQAFRAAATRDRHAELTGAVNTLLIGEHPAGFNTDVGGIVDALAEARVTDVDRVRILGAGATAASALVAASEIGATRADVRARRPAPAAALAELGERLGMVVDVRSFDAPSETVELTLATLPSGTTLPADTATALAAQGGVLFDAAYAPWPSALAGRWADGITISGLGMLLHQAVRGFELWFGNRPAVTPELRALVEADLTK